MNLKDTHQSRAIWSKARTSFNVATPMVPRIAHKSRGEPSVHTTGKMRMPPWPGSRKSPLKVYSAVPVRWQNPQPSKRGPTDTSQDPSAAAQTLFSALGILTPMLFLSSRNQGPDCDPRVQPAETLFAFHPGEGGKAESIIVGIVSWIKRGFTCR